MVATTATTIAVVETALFAAVPVLLGVRAALVLALAFWTGAELGTTVATAIVATITAATATAAAMILATTVASAIAAFVTTTFAARTFVLTNGWCCRSLLGRIAAKEAFQPAEEARFFGFGNGRRGFRFKRALFATGLFTRLFFAFTELLAAITGRLTTRFAGAKLVARFLRLFATSRTIV